MISMPALHHFSRQKDTLNLGGIWLRLPRPVIAPLAAFGYALAVLAGNAIALPWNMFFWVADSVAVIFLLHAFSPFGRMYGLTAREDIPGSPDDQERPEAPLRLKRGGEVGLALLIANLACGRFIEGLALPDLVLRALASALAVGCILACLLPYYRKRGEFILARLSCVTRLFLGGGLVGPVLAAALLAALNAPASAGPDDFLLAWLLQAVMASAGFCMTLPFLMVLFRLSPADLSFLIRTRGSEAPVMLSCLLALALLSLLSPASWHISPFLHFLFFPVLLWAASRFGPVGAAVLVALLGLVANLAALRHLMVTGLTSDTGMVELAEIQAFILGHVIVGLVVAAILAERDRARIALERWNQELEKRVAERTADLQHSNIELRQEVFQSRGKETELRAREETLRSLVEGMPLPMLVSRLSDGAILHINLPASALLKLDPTQALRRKMPEFLCNPALRQIRLEQLEANGRLENIELMYRDREGHCFWGLVNALAISYRGEKAALLTILDIDRRKQQEKALEDARLEAEAASRAKSEFLATISHEIRTPLNGVIGMADRLSRTSLDRDQNHYLELIRISGEMLLSLIGDVLDMSRIEAGEMDIRPVTFDLPALVSDVAQLVEVQAAARDLTLRQDIAADLPVQIKADPQRLRQILFNLLANAVKFTDSGHVSLQITWQPERDNQVRLQITVTDTGIGISEADCKRLFEPFFQSDKGETRRFEGSGLGLAISHRLAKAMGGDIAVQSEPGQGSCFTLTLPVLLAGNSLKTSQSVMEQKAPPLSILVAEDNPINQEVVAGLLESKGHLYRLVSDGQEALDALQEEDFDLVFMDLRMPGMDGIATTRAIRSLSLPDKAAIPVVAMTANTRPEDMRRAMDAGMNHFIGKPVKPDRLDRVILETWLGVSPSDLPVQYGPAVRGPEIALFNRRKGDELRRLWGNTRADGWFAEARQHVSDLLAAFIAALELRDGVPDLAILEQLQAEADRYCLEQLREQARHFRENCLLPETRSGPLPDFSSLAARSLTELDSWLAAAAPEEAGESGNGEASPENQPAPPNCSGGCFQSEPRTG